MKAPTEHDRDAFAEHLAEVFRRRYAEVVEEEGPDEAFRAAHAAMQEALEARRKERSA